MLTALRDTAPFQVLIVDDDPYHRALEREILDSARYVVTEAASGLEALDLLSKCTFDVVLLDKRMPGLDGDEVCRRIRGELALDLLPILMVTGNGDLDNLSLSLSAGASDFLRKPYEPVELLARLDCAADRNRVTSQLDSAESMLFALARMVEAKDSNTGDHCSRLSDNAVGLGRALGLDATDQLALRRAGVLHDIGKLGIPDSILLKPGPLTDAEWVIMRRHVDIGATLVGGLKSMRHTMPIIRHHHERWDGSGYPDGLRGNEISLLVQVFQLVDIYDALAYARPYKAAMQPCEIVTTFEAEVARGWRNPELTRFFLDLVRQRPHELAAAHAADDDLGMSLFGEIRGYGGLDWDRTRAIQPTA